LVLIVHIWQPGMISMSTLRITTCLAIAMFILPGGYQAAPLSRTLRVLTYNIHHGEGTDNMIDLSRQAEIVNSVRPDLVALQEVDLRTERTAGVNQLEEIARLTGMHAEFGKAMDFSGGTYGVGVLSRWPIVSARNAPLPAPSEREPRTALTALVRVDAAGPLLRFTTTHLDQGADDSNRLVQAAHLNAALAADDGVQEILAGDMNSRFDAQVMKVLEGQWTNATTADPSMLLAPDGRPRFRGDYILVRPAHCWRVIEATVLDDRLASDHRPVLAVLEWIATCLPVEHH
jgi:endonuclease/exonuclease/phosphatase family metal-dependent hydrolase